MPGMILSQRIIIMLLQSFLYGLRWCQFTFWTFMYFTLSCLLYMDFSLVRAIAWGRLGLLKQFTGSLRSSLKHSWINFMLLFQKGSNCYPLVSIQRGTSLMHLSSLPSGMKL
uniref:Uncharacterized protein n=1 Tax=Arundo donax TaxID=35708 RepID=A0A0A9CPE9_ARUDO